MKLSTQVLIGLVLGVACGLCFGELASMLDVVGTAFIRLMQMSVIPYVVVSLIAGLGRLEADVARRLALRGGLWMLLLWSIALAVVVLFPIAFPDYQTASFFSTAMTAEPEPVDLLGLYIPANPLYAMVNNLMPAIVLFSLFLGVALLTLPGRAPLVEQLSVLSDALMRITEWVVRLAPFGVFALIASASGSMTLDELERLQVFALTYAVLAAFLALFVLPGLVAAVTPIRYRDVLQASREALVTAFAAGSVLVVLPILSHESRKLLEQGAEQHAEGDSVAEVVIPVAFNFPSVGKLTSLSFILFGGWFAGSNLSAADLPKLLGVGTFTMFGPNVMAIPFLLDLFRLPSDLFPVFMAVDVLTGRFFVLAATMHIFTLAILVSCSLEGRTRPSLIRLARWAIASVLGASLLLGGLRLYFANALDLEANTYALFVDMQLAGDPVPVVDRPPTRSDVGSHSVLELIRSSGTMVVCYGPDALPFAFRNESGDLVGYDVDVMHLLAHGLGVSINFHRVDRDGIARTLSRGDCDIAIGGLALTPERVEEMTFSTSYIDNTLAFLVPDHDRHAFATWASIRAMRDLRIAVPAVEHYLGLLERLLPEAELVPIDSPRTYFRGGVEDVDALAFGAESGGAWTLIYPDFAVAVPKPDPIGIPVAYAVRRGEWEWAAYLDAWIELKEHDHSLTRLYEHWILGQAARNVEPRWSVIRNVLHWVD